MSDDVSVRIDIPASYAQLSTLSGCIGDLLGQVAGLTDRERLVFAVQLAAHETCTNIIDHAYAGVAGGRIEASLRLLDGPRRILVEIVDWGRPWDPEAYAEPDLSEPREGGYGMVLIRSLVDEVSYRREGGANRWRLVKAL